MQAFSLEDFVSSLEKDGIVCRVEATGPEIGAPRSQTDAAQGMHAADHAGVLEFAHNMFHCHLAGEEKFHPELMELHIRPGGPGRDQRRDKGFAPGAGRSDAPAPKMSAKSENRTNTVIQSLSHQRFSCLSPGRQVMAPGTSAAVWCTLPQTFETASRLPMFLHEYQRACT